MRRSKSVPLGEYGRRVASGVIVAGLAAVGLAGCDEDPQQQQQQQYDAQPVCGREIGGQVIVVAQAQCEDADPDRDDDGGTLMFFHFPYQAGYSYPRGSTLAASGSSHSVKPSTVPPGYRNGSIKVGGFGSGGGAKAGAGAGGGAGKGGSGGG